MSRQPSLRVLSLPGNDEFAGALATSLGGVIAPVKLHHFPDGESLVQLEEEAIRDCTAVLVCTLDRPDDKFLPLYFIASTLRELGAKRIVLVAPYLAYMRQDRRFHPGEGVTARYFARLLSGFVDGFVTVDPHLHRIHDLGDVYSVPSRVVHAAPAIAEWIRQNVTNPVLIGPDGESEQWVSDVARRAGVPFTVLQKQRHGDRDVEVSLPEVERWHENTPVLVDDIISTGHTMTETIGHLKHLGLQAPVCVGVHAVFAQDAYTELLQAGASRVVTANSISHESNAIDLRGPVASAVCELLEQLSDK